MDTNASQLQPGLSSYEQTARRHREKLAFVEHICGVMIESRSVSELPTRPWRVFDGDVEGMFSKESVCDLMPDWAFEFMPGEFAFSRFVSHGSARPGAEIAGLNSPNQQSGIVVDEFLSCRMSSLSPTTLGRGSPAIPLLPFGLANGVGKQKCHGL